jgi:hypothetical protein
LYSERPFLLPLPPLEPVDTGAELFDLKIERF